MNKTYVVCTICHRNLIDVSDVRMSHYHAGATHELSFVCEGCRKPVPKELEKYEKKKNN